MQDQACTRTRAGRGSSNIVVAITAIIFLFAAGSTFGQTIRGPITVRTAPVLRPAKVAIIPTFDYTYTLTGVNNLDAAIDTAGDVYWAFDYAGNVYIRKNLGLPEFVSLGSRPAIAIDRFNDIHVAYTNTALNYKKKTGSVWSSEKTVPGGTVFYTIDTDSTGTAHIASDDGGVGGRGHIVYAKDDAGTWGPPLWEATGWYDSGCRCGNYFHFPVIRIDGQDKYHLAFEADNWGGQASWSEKSISITTNSTFGDKSVGGIGWNTGINLSRHALAFNGADSYFTYSVGGTQNVALVNDTWTVLSSFPGSEGSIYYKNGVLAVSYVAGGNVNYIEDTGTGFSAPVDLGAGSNPIVLLGSRHVFFQSGADIKLASSKFLVPTAASVAVTGRVITAAGTPVRQARVVLQDGSGNKQTAVCNAFGYYRFDSVTAGDTYLLSAGARGYTFTPRLVSVTDEMTGVDLIALP